MVGMRRDLLIFGSLKAFSELQDDTYVRTWRGWYQAVVYTLGYRSNNVSGGGGAQTFKSAENREVRPNTIKHFHFKTCLDFSNALCNFSDGRSAGHRFMTH